MAASPRRRNFRVSAVLITVILVTLGVPTMAPPAFAATCTQTDPIDRYYCQVGGAASFLGQPTSGTYVVGTGRARDFQGGTVLWSSSTGAHSVRGAIRTAYRNAGAASGYLGFPLTDE